MENLKYTEILQRNSALKKTVSGPQYKISVLSNVTMNSLKEILEYSLRLHRINPVIELGNYDNIVQDSATCTTSDMVIIFYETLNIVDGVGHFFEGLGDEAFLNLKKKILAEIDIIFENLKNNPSVIFNKFSSAHFTSSPFFDSRLNTFIKDLNNYLEERKPLNFDLADVDKIIASAGTAQSFDLRMFNSSKAPYTLSFLKNYALAIRPVVFRNTGKLKKAIIFDCDNTLWKGILGEDGADKIDMSVTSAYGKSFHAVQQLAVYLSKKGVLIGICSKNNEADVLDVLRTHPDMVLKEEHIVIKKINWDDKATNLKSIASELNIGIDSLVFVDDSAFETTLVREQLPDVTVIQVPEATYEYPEYLLGQVYSYFNLSASGEDLKKTEIYKQQFQRENTKNNFGTIDDYLASLEIVLSFYEDDSRFLQRTAQLTQKTNQFNLTTRRYTENQIAQFVERENSHVFVVSVKDKFGDNGLTALCIVHRHEQDVDTAVIDTFLMSCRIIGRNIEFEIINYVFGRLWDHGYRSVKAKYIATKKNVQVEKFYDNVGFSVLSDENETRHYLIDLAGYHKKKIGYIKTEDKSSVSSSGN